MKKTNIRGYREDGERTCCTQTRSKLQLKARLKTGLFISLLKERIYIAITVMETDLYNSYTVYKPAVSYVSAEAANCSVLCKKYNLESQPF